MHFLCIFLPQVNIQCIKTTSQTRSSFLNDNDLCCAALEPSSHRYMRHHSNRRRSNTIVQTNYCSASPRSRHYKRMQELLYSCGGNTKTTDAWYYGLPAGRLRLPPLTYTAPAEGFINIYETGNRGNNKYLS